MISHAPVATRSGWFSLPGPERDIVLSSRIRLKRNISSLPFYPRMTSDEELHLRRLLEATFDESSRTFVQVDGATVNDALRRYFVERGILDPDNDEAYAFLARDGRQIIRSGPSDHVVCDTIRGGLDLEETLQEAFHLDAELEQRLQYAVALHHGYLFPDIERVGSGLSASIMVHLPGLEQSGGLVDVSRELRRENVGIRAFGSGSDSTAALYLVLARANWGMNEADTLAELEGYGEALLHYERAARDDIFADHRDVVVEAGHRAFGTLRHARRLSVEEAFGLLSVVRFAVSFGEPVGLELEAIDELLFLIQPGHVTTLQSSDAGEDEPEAERRAAFVRDIIEEKISQGD